VFDVHKGVLLANISARWPAEGLNQCDFHSYSQFRFQSEAAILVEDLMPLRFEI